MRDQAPNEAVPDLPGYRAMVVAGLAGSVLITWPLWSVRAAPPLLPVVHLPELSLGVPLVVATLLALVAPGLATAIVTVLIAYGMAADQTRMQPEFFSLPLLLWGTLPLPSARLIARVHLVALWFYAGLHKMLSAEYRTEAGPRLLAELPVILPPAVLISLAMLAAVWEVGTAIMALVPSFRRLAAWSALVLHLGIVASFVAVGEMGNVAVWPWNLVLAGSGFALIAPWRGRLLADLTRAAALPRLIAVILLVAPLGFYAGVVDAYPAHNLYASGTARATVYCPADCRPEQDLNATWHALRVPLPPQPRLFIATFSQTCQPGDVLRIDDPRPPPWDARRARRVYFCPVGSLPASHV